MTDAEIIKELFYAKCTFQAETIKRIMTGETAAVKTSIVDGEIVVREITREEFYNDRMATYRDSAKRRKSGSFVWI